MKCHIENSCQKKLCLKQQGDQVFNWNNDFYPTDTDLFLKTTLQSIPCSNTFEIWSILMASFIQVVHFFRKLIYIAEQCQDQFYV